jgi:hypothetical protein
MSKEGVGSLKLTQPTQHPKVDPVGGETNGTFREILELKK